jgi:hypothetical protein
MTGMLKSDLILEEPIRRVSRHAVFNELVQSRAGISVHGVVHTVWLDSSITVNSTRVNRGMQKKKRRG